LFLCVGVVYDRLHTREIDRYGGLVNNMPKYAFTFMLFMLASVGLPGTAGFVGEFLVLTGTFQTNTWVALLAATGVVLGAAYMLYLYRRVVYGELTKDDVKAMADLEPREIAIFVPIIAVVMWMGVYPMSFLNVMDESVAHMLKNYHDALAATKAAGIEPLGSSLLAWLK
jgi:NADH-quinone oxidoreductase subunit M